MNTQKSRQFSALTFILIACGALTGCSGDKDNDGIDDRADQCMTVPAGAHPDPTRPGCPANDTDLDGVFDHEDHCRFEARGNDPDTSRPGCPKPPATTPTIVCGPTVGDCDGDGVADNLDQCPSVPKSDHESASRRGCPWEDRDGDGTEDAFDDCVADAPGAHPDPTNPDECPDYDNDEDGLRNSEDTCPDEKANPTDGDGGQIIGASGLSNDPARPGCLLHPVEDAGTTEDVSDTDASVTADAVSDSGTVDAAADVTDVTDVQDAGVPTATDVPPGNGNTTVIVQVNPPVPTPVVDAGAPSQPIPTERTVSGLAIGTLIEGASDRQTANAFCWVSRRQVEYLMSHAFNRECREGETSCWRLSNASVHVPNCDSTATPGCRYADGRIFACAEGAESVIVRRCAQGTVPCTAQNLADAERARRPRR